MPSSQPQKRAVPQSFLLHQSFLVLRVLATGAAQSIHTPHRPLRISDLLREFQMRPEAVTSCTQPPLRPQTWVLLPPPEPATMPLHNDFRPLHHQTLVLRPAVNMPSYRSRSPPLTRMPRHICPSLISSHPSVNLRECRLTSDLLPLRKRSLSILMPKRNLYPANRLPRSHPCSAGMRAQR